MTDQELIAQISFFFVVPPEAARAWWAARYPGVSFDQGMFDQDLKDLLGTPAGRMMMSL